MRALFLTFLLTFLLLPQFALTATLPDGAAGAHATLSSHDAGARHDTRCNGHTSTCLELDCSTCHAHGAAMAPTASVPQWLALGTAPITATERRHTPPWHERPYRPQWTALSEQG
ncbi:hypothetical protein [Hydrogenophaga sp. 2FB]|uniref:hypothetical protein n=1 Tax=Hydrogenophaga sp. 2FB TaxID=2502187 RepID=UPI0010F77EC1|nr:hypothetical protein [Hydrogenophaga sp. 2FB]